MTYLLKSGLRRYVPWAASAVCFTAVVFGNPVFAATEGEVAPSWSAQSIGNGEVTFPAAADGQPSVVLFWATWCPYCKALMPYLDALRKEYEDQGVRVFAINIKEDGDPRAFAEHAGYDFVYLLEGDTIAEQYAVRFTPGLFVIDADNTIVFRRKSTELPPGKKVAEFWAERVRAVLDKTLGK